MSKINQLLHRTKPVNSSLGGGIRYTVPRIRQPAHLLVPLANALGVSTDDMLDTKKETADIDDNLAKIFRKLKVVSTFSNKDKKAVFHFVQTIEEKNKVQRKTSHPAK